MKGAESMRKRMMRKRMIVHLAIGIICLLSGIIMAVFHVSPIVFPITMIALGGGLITTWFVVCTYISGDILIIDEMDKRIDALSGSYTFTVSMYFLCVLCIITYFFPLLLNTSGLLLTMMFFNGILYHLIRYYLKKRGKTE